MFSLVTLSCLDPDLHHIENASHSPLIALVFLEWLRCLQGPARMPSLSRVRRTAAAQEMGLTAQPALVRSYPSSSGAIHPLTQRHVVPRTQLTSRESSNLPMWSVLEFVQLVLWMSGSAMICKFHTTVSVAIESQPWMPVVFAAWNWGRRRYLLRDCQWSHHILDPWLSVLRPRRYLSGGDPLDTAYRMNYAGTNPIRIRQLGIHYSPFWASCICLAVDHESTMSPAGPSSMINPSGAAVVSTYMGVSGTHHFPIRQDREQRGLDRASPKPS